MATRDELLNTYEMNLNGFLLPASGRNDQYIVAEDKRSAVIEVEQSVDGTHVLERHIVFYWDDDKNVKGNEQFYVKDPNTANEEAVWMRGNDPKPPAPEPTFQEQATMWLHDKVGSVVGSYTIMHIAGVSADAAAETATAHVLVEKNGVLQWLDVYLWLNKTDDVQFRVIS